MSDNSSQMAQMMEMMAQMKLAMDKQATELAELRADPPAKRKVTKPRKERVKKVKVALSADVGVNASANILAQAAGQLAPFHHGHCRCRVWGDGIGSQCSHKAMEGCGADGKPEFCKTHEKKMNMDGYTPGWYIGMYDEPRPENWGPAIEAGMYLPKCSLKAVKAHTGTIWDMPQETYTKAFAEMWGLEQEQAPPAPPANLPAVNEHGPLLAASSSGSEAGSDGTNAAGSNGSLSSSLHESSSCASTDGKDAPPQDVANLADFVEQEVLEPVLEQSPPATPPTEVIAKELIMEVFEDAITKHLSKNAPKIEAHKAAEEERLRAEGAAEMELAMAGFENL
jgi:hypothetical protein